MTFTAEPSAAWFDISPLSGTISANASTAISISAIYANALPANNNKGSIIITAPGYVDNTQLSLSLSCGIYGPGTPDPNTGVPDPSTAACHLSVVCPPCSTNTAGNTAYSITSVIRTSGAALYQLSTNANLPPQTQVIISGMEDDTFNGTYLVTSSPLATASQFVVTQQASLPDAMSGTGTAYVPERATCPW